ncbi:hypothetical protein TWF694_006599 [Orbilia ellipsospora]|uniref:Uncharacterized protein n=1 Tax=Orbilia ellipsospora TaxID=2528407 RepID=A0AAV9XL20_9PEZI
MQISNILLGILATASAVAALPSGSKSISEIGLLRRTIKDLETRLADAERRATLARRDTSCDPPLISIPNACMEKCAATNNNCLGQPGVNLSTCASDLAACEAKCL